MKKHHISWLILILAIVLIGWASISSYIKRNAQTVDIEQVVKDNAGQSNASSTEDMAPVDADHTGDYGESKQFKALIDKTVKGAVITFADGSIVKAPLFWQEGEFYNPWIQAMDVNFDGYDDLMLSYMAGAYNVGTRFYVQNPQTHAFRLYEIDARPHGTVGNPDSTDYTELSLAKFDKDKREIYSFYKGRGVGDIYVVNTFRFGSQGWYLAEVEQQDGVGNPDDTGYYFRDIVRYDEKGKSATTTTYYKLVQGADGSSNFVGVTKAEAESHAQDKRGG